jgi:fumarate hydratase subunit beta
MKRVYLPLTRASITSLFAGDEIVLCGTLYTARDAAHKRFQKAIKEKRPLPVKLRGNILYYCGPTPGRPPKSIGACGPTTSGRMDRFTPELIDMGLSATIGKGRRSDSVVQAIKKNKALYLIAIGGAGAYLGNRVKRARPIAYKDLGAEAVYELQVEDFPVIVAIDSKGNSIFRGKYHAAW